MGEICFDKISLQAIYSALRFFDFPDYIINWTKILYTNFRLKIQNNGKFSEEFPVERGIHQGGVNSTNVFLVVAEILALELRANRRIQGIPVQDIINLLSQFADDMDWSMLCNEQSLNETISELERFKNSTGFTINLDKTKIFRAGALQNTDFELITQKEIAWTNNPINWGFPN